MQKVSILSFLSLSILSLSMAGFAQPSFASALDDPGSRTSGTAAGGLTPVVAEIDAGEVTVGASAQVVMRFRNDGSKDIKISKMDLYPSSTVSASVAIDECSKSPLAPGAECAIIVNVKGLKTGNWRVETLVRHDAKSRITTAAMKGTVQSGENATDSLLSDVETIPSDIDFGTLNSGRPLVKSVILRNVTSESLEITNISVSPESSGYSLNSECSKLGPGEACAASVTWAPSAKGQADGIMLIQHTGSTKVASVQLKGSYDPEQVEKADMFPQSVTGKGLMVSSEEALDFGTISNEASMTVSLVNVGDAEMTIKKIQLGGVENGLKISSQGCKPGTVLSPVEACPLTLTWSAVREGSMIDDVQIAHDGARGILVIPVRGTASAAVNKDTKAVVVQTTSAGKEIEGPVELKPAEKSQALEGFIITSHSGDRAIINGPGGSRVVSKGQQITLGGVRWVVDITNQGVDFVSGSDRIRLLFDRSLSSVNRTATQSTGSTSNSSGSSASASSRTSPSSSSSSSTRSSSSPSSSTNR